MVIWKSYWISTKNLKCSKKNQTYITVDFFRTISYITALGELVFQCQLYYVIKLKY